MRFTDQSLYEIIQYINLQLTEEKERQKIIFEIFNPDLAQGKFSGETLFTEGNHYIYRSYKIWMDLAESFDCRFTTPIPVDNFFVKITFEKLNITDSWHRQQDTTSDNTEKYGTDSDFSRINKSEEPGFLMEYLNCLTRVSVKEGDSILDLGINRGDEFAIFKQNYDKSFLATLNFTGVDHSGSAIARADKRFPQDNFHFIEGDINYLSELNINKHDLIISIGTLQSPGVNSDQILRNLVQNHLNDQGRLILGFPNCRYVDGEIKYGAKVKNYSHPELSLVLKDIIFYKKYLQQHKFRVTITGKYYLFLTAIPMKRKQ